MRRRRTGDLEVLPPDDSPRRPSPRRPSRPGCPEASVPRRTNPWLHRSPFLRRELAPRPHHLAVLALLRLGVDPRGGVALGLPLAVVLVGPLAPPDLAVALEREDVRRHAVEEVAVVRDDDRAPGERLERL